MTDRRKKINLNIAILWIITTFLLCACGKNTQPKSEESKEELSIIKETVDTGFVLTGPDSYDSADTAILVSRDEKEGTITFLNLELGKKYTLSVDGTTRFYDKYGEGISANQVNVGDIADVRFLKSKKHLTSLQLAPSAWVYDDVERYEINSIRGEISIGSEVYKITSNTQFFSDKRSIDIQDLNSTDILSFQGIDSQILTVKVKKGHGYLRLTNDENFIGGWIEIGQSQIQRINEDMLLLIPEGSYQVNISHKGGGGTKSILINRNEETVLDIGDLQIPEPQYGNVLFSLNPASAELYIDGTMVDTSGPVQLLYGLHQLIARQEGYQSVTQYIRVAQESAGINVVLDPHSVEEEEESSETTNSEDLLTNYFKIYVDAPEKAEVYVDGNYVGIAPCSFRKTSGTHVITLRMNGYETRSYTVQVENDEKDLSYSFADLIASTSPSEEKDKSED